LDSSPRNMWRRTLTGKTSSRQFMLVLGIPVGAYLAARLSQKAVSFSGALPDMWVSRFGTSNTQRWVVGILGGIFVGFGARLADG
jgi:uncharacterized membrane protein YedE/YeeE